MVVKVVNTRTGEEADLSSMESAESLVEKSDDWIFAKRGEEMEKSAKPKVEDLKEPDSEPTESQGPVWQERVVIQRNRRNITVELWPPSDEHPEYGHSLRLVESRNNNGEWEQKSINLTKGPKTLFLAEMIKQGWHKLREAD